MADPDPSTVRFEPDVEWRPPSPHEGQLVQRMLRESFSGRDELVQQWASAEVRTIDECGCLAIRTTPGSPPCRTEYRVPVEGSWPDDDRIMVEVLLHVDNAGYLHELEFVRYGGSSRVDELNPETMWVFGPPYRP